MTDYSKHSVVDLFAGTGVGVAVRNLGAKEWGVERMKEAIATRKANGMATIFEDVWDVHYLEQMVYYGFWFDTLWGSPPCPSFSMAGTGSGRRQLDLILAAIREGVYRDMASLRTWADSLEDDRTGLTLTPLHYAHKFRPTYIALEQVPPVLPVWEAMAVELRTFGYSVWTGLLHAEQFGVPQTRKRAILMARLDGPVAPPVPTHSKYHNRTPERLDEGVLPWVSMEQALSWPVNRPAPTVTGGGVESGGAEPFGRRGRDAIRRASRGVELR